MNYEDHTIKLTWFQRKKYSGRFIAYSENNKIYASDKNYWECKHKAREKLTINGSGLLRHQLKFSYVEKKSNIYRGLFFVSLGFLIFEKMMYDILLMSNIQIYKKSEIFIFYNSVILSIFLASLLIISPVVKSHNPFGIIGQAIVNKEKHLGWEVSLMGISAFIFLETIVIIITIFIEFEIILNLNYMLAVSSLLIIQAFYTIKEERLLKKLHYYLIDQITLEDRLSYDDIVSYLAEIPEIKGKNLLDNSSLFMTLEASLESPFSITRVMAFHILFRDLGIMLGSIIISFGVGYVLYFNQIVANLVGTRIFGALLTAGLLLFYAIIKRSTSTFFAISFVKSHPHFTLRPGGLDRFYTKFFPVEVNKLKEQTILTILKQSVLLTAGLGLFFLIYATELLLLISFTSDYVLIDIINSVSLALGMILVFIFILYIAKSRTEKWIEIVENEMLELDKKLESQIGLTPNQILNYLTEAQINYNKIHPKNN